MVVIALAHVPFPVSALAGPFDFVFPGPPIWQGFVLSALVSANLRQKVLGFRSRAITAVLAISFSSVL